MMIRKKQLEKWLGNINVNYYVGDDVILHKLGLDEFSASPKCISELQKELAKINELLQTGLGKTIYGNSDELPKDGGNYEV